MKNKIKIVVLMGGKTPEHEISFISGREVVKNLDKEKYEVLPIVISRSGESWNLVSPNKILKLEDPLEYKGTGKDLIKSGRRVVGGATGLADKGVDVVFIAMHGPFGEDGTVQGMLELAGLPYTGPGVLASALGMDKVMFRRVLSSQNIPLPKYTTVRKGKIVDKEKIKTLLGEPPYFVKPHNQGSSVGNTLVRKMSQLEGALDKAHQYSNTALVDEYIKGLEVTCGVIGNEEPEAFPLVEIHPKGEFFDYDSKYLEGGAEEIVPARLSEKLTKKIQDLAIGVYKAVDCRGFSRVDFILKNEREPLVLEVNTIPGLTPMSLLPKAAKAAGYSYSKFLDKIIEYATST